MKEKIKKIAFTKLCELPPNKALMGHDLQVAFEVVVGQSLNDHLEELKVAAQELEDAEYARFDMLPGGMFRVIKGINFDNWEDTMREKKQDSRFTIGNLNAQNVQVGDGNTLNVNLTPEEFLKALNQMKEEPEKADSILSELNEYLKQGVSLGALIGKFIALWS